MNIWKTEKQEKESDFSTLPPLKAQQTGGEALEYLRMASLLFSFFILFGRFLVTSFLSTYFSFFIFFESPYLLKFPCITLITQLNNNL